MDMNPDDESNRSDASSRSRSHSRSRSDSEAHKPRYEDEGEHGEMVGYEHDIDLEDVLDYGADALEYGEVTDEEGDMVDAEDLPIEDSERSVSTTSSKRRSSSSGVSRGRKRRRISRGWRQYARREAGSELEAFPKAVADDIVRRREMRDVGDHPGMRDDTEEEPEVPLPAKKGKLPPSEW